MGVDKKKSEKISTGNMGKTENGCMEKKEENVYKKWEKEWQCLKGILKYAQCAITRIDEEGKIRMKRQIHPQIKLLTKKFLKYVLDRN